MQRRKIKSAEEDVKQIQSTRPSLAKDTKNKLVSLEDQSRRNNLKINVIRKHGKEIWKDCTSKVFELSKSNLEINANDVVIERADRTEGKSISKSRSISSSSIALTL